MVCNSGPGITIFPRNAADSSARDTSDGSLYSDVVAKNGPPQDVRVSLSELQKLCIVLQMRSGDETHLDFVYSPKDCT